MPKVNRSFAGFITGKRKEQTFYDLNGQNVFRDRPISVQNPKTPLQTRNRQRLANLVRIYQNAAGLIQQGFQNKPEKQSQYNAFISQNNPECFTIVSKETEPAGENLVVSTGLLTKPTSIAGNFTSGEFTVNWDTNNVRLNDAASDKLVVGVMLCLTDGAIDVAAEEFALLNATGTRGAVGSETFTVPADIANGDATVAFAFFVSDTGVRSSDSIAAFGVNDT